MAAVYMDNLSVFHGKYEVLFPAGTTFQVKEIENVNENFTKVLLEKRLFYEKKPEEK